ncbi:MAG: helix-turn-helix domain-containing protein [Microlunatus sp.]|nr:helix-turn-helix domain-containing protein [Microlunatus sp.]
MIIHSIATCVCPGHGLDRHGLPRSLYQEVFTKDSWQSTIEVMPDDRTAPPTPAPLDAKRLRALAHPLRVRILELLELDGPATATILADRLGVKTGSTSWHLLKLAENGFVEGVPDRGNRRERWWRATQAGWAIDHSQFSDDAELADAGATLLNAVLSQQLLRAGRFLEQDWSPAWRKSWILSTELGLRLDPERLAALRADLWAVIERYKSRPSSSAAAEHVVFQMQGFPYRPAGRS